MSTHYRKCLLWYFTETLENTNYRDMILLPFTKGVRVIIAFLLSIAEEARVLVKALLSLCPTMLKSCS